MEPAVTVHELRGFIIENYLFGQESDLKDEDSFLEAGILDSTGVLQLVAFLEEKYDITVEEGELTPENLDSINNIVAYLSRKIGKTGEKKVGNVLDAAALGGDK